MDRKLSTHNCNVVVAMMMSQLMSRNTTLPTCQTPYIPQVPIVHMLIERIDALEKRCAEIVLESKVLTMRRLLHEYRRHNSMDATDAEYYGIVLLHMLSAWVAIKDIEISMPFDFSNTLALDLLHRATKNDNLTLRMLAFYFINLSTMQLAEFEAWCDPLDQY